MSDSDSERKARKAEKKRKRAEKEDQAQAAAAAAADAADDEAAAAAATTTGTEEERAAQKAARKAARRAARHAEVMQAGARALEEERQEEEAAAAAAAKASQMSDAAAAPSEEEDREARKRRKREKREAEAAAAAASSSAAAAAAAPSSADATEEDEEARRERKRAKKEKKERAAREEAASSSSAAAAASLSASAAAAAPSSSSSSSSSAAAAAATDPAAPKVYPPPPPGNVTLLLFYQYVRPSWSASARQNAENFTRQSLQSHGCTGRLRCAREGFNGTLTGPAEGIRAFCQDLREYEPQHFGQTDFKFVDGLRENQMLRGLKVWHVDELVTYGFGTKTCSIESGGTHLPPQEWHDKAAEENTVLIDVRNANENAIGRFQPLNDAARVLDPNMRTSTEFPDWVRENMEKLKGAKQVMMYCTGGIRCERASALLVENGIDSSRVFQLEGGIHRYLEAFPDGGHWIGKNYTFDRRFAHGATSKTPEVVGRCCLCTAPWDRYQAGKKCSLCRMEVLVCRECERGGKAKSGVKFKCHLCGGPKPSYLPEGDKTLKLKQKKHYAHADAEY